MENSKCYLCGSVAKFLLPPPTSLCKYIECPNCGQYKISVQAIICKSYKKSSRVIVAGDVFSSFYYEHQVKLVKMTDFDNTRQVSTLEKLYSLAKYIFTEEKNGVISLVQRPACCYENNKQGYALLMRELKRLNIIDYLDTEDDDDDVTSRFTDVSMTPYAKIAFEDGITSTEHFREVFMSKANSGDTFNISSAIIGKQIGGDFIMGNKTEQIGIKGDNNTVGGSIDQHIGTKKVHEKKKFWSKAKIIYSVIVGLATIVAAIFAGVQVWQNHQAKKPQVEASTVLETPSVVSPAE